MSNKEIVTSESILKGYEYNGENLFTFQEWRKRGYTVSKGEKAFISTNLWRPISKKEKDGTTTKKIILVKACLFNIGQVQKLEA